MVALEEYDVVVVVVDIVVVDFFPSPPLLEDDDFEIVELNLVVFSVDDFFRFLVMVSSSESNLLAINFFFDATDDEFVGDDLFNTSLELLLR